LRDKKKAKTAEPAEQQPADVAAQKNSAEGTNQEVKDDLQKLLDAELNPFTEQEKNIVRLLLNYGNNLIEVQHLDSNEEPQPLEISVAEYVLNDLLRDELSFIDPVYQMFLYEFLLQMRDGKIPAAAHFTNHNNPNLSATAINLISSNYTLSDKWKSRHNIYISHETDNLKKTVDHDLYAYKERRLQKLLKEEIEKLRNTTSEEEIQNLLISIQKLDAQKALANKLLGRTII
jgi:DNA primase